MSVDLSAPFAPFIVFKMLIAFCYCISDSHLLLIQHFIIVLLDVFLQASLKMYIASPTWGKCPSQTPHFPLLKVG